MLRSRTLAWLALWLGSLVLALRPVRALERGLDWLAVPLRYSSELAAPLAWLGAGEAAAAERALAASAASEAAEGGALLASLAAAALPSEELLAAGRAFVPAEVVARPSRDECWVVLPATGGIDLGAPVVRGDAFVGRVVELVPEPGGPGRARVELVTAAGFRVGAEVRAEDPVYLVVGGVRVPRPRSEPRSVRLAVHQPSAGPVAGGLARVRELFGDADAVATLADGFRLGILRGQGGRADLWIEPELDYLDGLFQLAVVARPGRVDPGAFAPPVALADERWAATRALTVADPAFWRSTEKLPLGRGVGLVAGSAVTSVGARLVGRVARVGLLVSDVALLDDPGFSLPAVARVEGSADPLVLGRLTTVGRAPGGAVRMRWSVRVAFGASGEAGELGARLFTGSGEPGLPGGLFLGETRLPRSARAGEERVIELDPGPRAGPRRRLFVRLEREPLP